MIDELFAYYTQKTINYFKNIFRSQVNTALNENEMQNTIKKVTRKTNDIVYESQAERQTEMVKRSLRKRQDEIDKTNEQQKDIKQAEILTRKKLYTTLLYEEKAKKDKQDEKQKDNTKQNANTFAR